jgi:hypothetical protein
MSVAAAFLFIFAVDRYLLLRRWEQGPQVGLSVTKTLRAQVRQHTIGCLYVNVYLLYVMVGI